MKPCSCGFDGIGEILGVFCKADGTKHHIPFNCPGCGTTRRNIVGRGTGGNPPGGGGSGRQESPGQYGILTFAQDFDITFLALHRHNLFPGVECEARKKSLPALKRDCFKEWGRIVLQRYPKCVGCGEKAVDPHHIFPKSRYRHLHFHLLNGVGLCQGCHYKTRVDPVIVTVKTLIVLGDKFDALYKDALEGRRKNPYGRKELEGILIALKAAE